MSKVPKNGFPNLPDCSCSNQTPQKPVTIVKSDCLPSADNVQIRLLQLVSSLTCGMGSSIDSPIIFLCNPDSGDIVIVRYKFSFIDGQQTNIPVDAWNLNGTPYTGDITLLVNCSSGGGGGGGGIGLAEYFICDNGLQKIVSLCGTSCGTVVVSFLLLNRLPTAAPSDWNKVTLGSCLDLRQVLTPSVGTFATIGVASSLAVPINTIRKGLVVTNTSGNLISLGLDVAAVLGSGITLNANGGVWEMDEFTFTTGFVFAIAAGAGSNLAIQEFV